jgi:hypothetical protein
VYLPLTRGGEATCGREHEVGGHGSRSVALARLRCFRHSSARPARYCMGRNGKEEQPYIQSSLVWGEAEVEAPIPEETELENCLVLSRPVYKTTKREKGENEQHWVVRVHAQPTMFQPEMDAVFLATATNEQAMVAHKHGLKPGDRTRIRGVLSPQAVPLNNGQAIQQISVTDLHVLSRTQRVSTTVFEQRQRR